MNITIRQLEAAAAVAEHGSFTRAATALGMTQPALSQQIRELEALLRIRLFDRTTRRVVPTKAGAEFIVTAVKVLADLGRAVSHAADLANRARGRLAVAAPPLLASTVLPAVIAAFSRMHPGIEVALFDVAPDRVMARVASGEADLGIGTFPTDGQGLIFSPIARDRLMLFERDDGAPAPPCRWEDLSSHAHIALTRESALRFTVDHGFAMAGQTMRPAFEVTQIATALSMVAEGLGVAVLPAFARLIGPASGIRSRALIAPELTRDIGTLRAADRSLPPGADDFLRILARRIISAAEGS